MSTPENRRDFEMCFMKKFYNFRNSILVSCDYGMVILIIVLQRKSFYRVCKPRVQTTWSKISRKGSA